MRQDPWGRELASPDGPADLWRTADESENGTDLTLLRRNLEWTPDERLQHLAEVSEGLAKLRGAAWPASVRNMGPLPAFGNDRQPLGRPFPEEDSLDPA